MGPMTVELARALVETGALVFVAFGGLVCAVQWVCRLVRGHGDSDGGQLPRPPTAPPFRAGMPLDLSRQERRAFLLTAHDCRELADLGRAR